MPRNRAGEPADGPCRLARVQTLTRLDGAVPDVLLALASCERDAEPLSTSGPADLTMEQGRRPQV